MNFRLSIANERSRFLSATYDNRKESSFGEIPRHAQEGACFFRRICRAARYFQSWHFMTISNLSRQQY
ncbi:hypothetical protein COOONC_23557 [Cooperia oncophora]